MLKDYSSLSNNEFSCLIRKLYLDRIELLSWAKKENKETLIKKLLQEIDILKQCETRLEHAN